MDQRIWVVAFLGACIDTGLSGPKAEEGLLGDPGQLENTTIVDEILQVTTPQADILWMIDNSCSMGNEQADLVENFPSFMNFFLGSGLDYHIAVTTSDTISSDYPGSAGTLARAGGVRVIDPDTPNAVQTFQAMANVGVKGKFPERGLGAVFLALEVKRDLNDDFFREEAALHTICISDEADYTEENVVTLNEFKGWYDGIKPIAADRTFSAIVAARGDRYAEVTQEIGGVGWDLVDDNWPGLLEELGIQASGFSQEYFLSQAPIASTIQVEVEHPDGAIQLFDSIIDYTYNEARNSITFVTEVPEERATVRITYQLVSTRVEETDQE